MGSRFRFVSSRLDGANETRGPADQTGFPGCNTNG